MSSSNPVRSAEPVWATPTFALHLGQSIINVPINPPLLRKVEAPGLLYKCKLLSDLGSQYVRRTAEGGTPLKIVKLKQEWTVGARIGSGGFGQVFAAENKDGLKAAVKLVPKAPGANRELLFVDLKDIRGVVPIIDSGEDGNHWVLVMPRADKSLRQHLTSAAGPARVTDATSVLMDIASALAELDGKIVHRDLKPENVLYLDGTWRLSDFGISRYAEATTAADTQKYSLSAPYAAPERWRAERATGAADVYALGIMAFEMLHGSRPFPGPDIEDYREQHLHEALPLSMLGPLH